MDAYIKKFFQINQKINVKLFIEVIKIYLLGIQIKDLKKKV